MLAKRKHRCSTGLASDFFEKSYIPEPNSGCWLWEAGVSGAGYGLIQCADYYGYAHRYSFMRHKGKIPAGKFVCHQCDMPACVNPEHLWAGSSLDNTQDCLSKGRHGSVTSPDSYVLGEDHGRAVLTEAKVIEIRRLYGTRMDGQKNTHNRLAEMFDCSPATIAQVVTRRTWKHI